MKQFITLKDSQQCYIFVSVQSTTFSHKCVELKEQYFNVFHPVLNNVHFTPEESRTDCKHLALLGIVEYNVLLSLTVNNTNCH